MCRGIEPTLSGFLSILCVRCVWVLETYVIWHFICYECGCVCVFMDNEPTLSRFSFTMSVCRDIELTLSGFFAWLRIRIFRTTRYPDTLV